MSIIKWISVMILAVAIAAVGEMTRTYSAFGGEDLLALVLVGYAGYKLMREVRNDEE